jgi:hypothetical protein
MITTTIITTYYDCHSTITVQGRDAASAQPSIGRFDAQYLIEHRKAVNLEEAGNAKSRNPGSLYR